MEIRTKQELEKWIIAANNAGYSVPCYIRGGGFSWVNDWEAGIEITDKPLSTDEDYEDELDNITDGDEIEIFKEYMTEDELDGVSFVRVNHRTGYNEENFDYFFGIYDY